MATLDSRLDQEIESLEIQLGYIFTNQEKLKLKEGIFIGGKPKYNWEYATIIVTKRALAYINLPELA